MGGFGGGSWGGGAWGGSSGTAAYLQALPETVTITEGLVVDLPYVLLGANALTSVLVEATFSHDVDLAFPANFSPTNYGLSPALTVLGVAIGSTPRSVYIATAEQAAVNYTLTVTTGRSTGSDLLAPSNQTALFPGFPDTPRFFATAQSKRKLVLIFSSTMDMGDPAFTTTSNYVVRDLNGNAVAVSSVTPDVVANRATLALGADLIPGGYYVLTINAAVQTVTSRSLSPPTDLFQWASMEATITTGPITIPFSSFSGEITTGLLGQPAGQIFFSPALDAAMANSVIQIEEVALCTRAFDSYEFPQPLDPPILFTFSPVGPSGSLGPATVLWAPPERLGLVHVELASRHTETMPASDDGPADATLVEPIDITRAAFLNDARWTLTPVGLGTQAFITADNLTPIGPGPTVNINLQP